MICRKMEIKKIWSKFLAEYFSSKPAKIIAYRVYSNKRRPQLSAALE